jgi:transcriptional regulator of acetoin/glycerol metabolism
MDKQLIIDTLTRIVGNISAATVLTGINRQSLHFKIKKYGIKKSEIIVNLKEDVVFQ